MHYRRILILRWSRRDWLAVLVVALVAAMLVGATLLVVTAGDQTETLASEFEANGTVTQYDSFDAARAAAGSDAVVLPTATASNGAGDSHRVVGVPEPGQAGIDLPPPPETAVGPVTADVEWHIAGDRATETTVVTPGGDGGLLPASWFRATPELVERVGPTGALVVDPSSESTPDEGAPLVGVLSFFIGGTNNLVGILLRGVAIAGLIVGVTTFSIVRLLVSERAQTIRVARATGATPRRIQFPLAARAGLLTAVGVAFGYAIGVIVPNTAINVAVFLGVPTTLSLQVTATMAPLLSGMLCVLVLVGVLSGYLAARAATAVPVAQVQPGSTADAGSWADRLPERVRRVGRPTLLAPRTVVPAMVTLTAFAMIALLVASVGGLGASLGTDGTTITEPGAPHPVGSELPESYADALDNATVTASPEIVLLGYRDGEPYLARGGRYESFAAVTGAELTAGRAPAAADEAVVGVDAADTLGLGLNDELTVGGSTDAGIAQVTVVGRYETGGIDDHQLLLSLATARHLTTVREGQVNLIRTDTAITDSTAPATPTVLDVDAPRYGEPDSPIRVTATLWNPGTEPRDRTLRVTLGDRRVERAVTIPSQERTTVEAEFEGLAEGRYEVDVGFDEQTVSRTVNVTDTAPLAVAYPAEVVPGEPVQVRVSESRGGPVENGTVSLAGATASLDAAGTTRIRTPEEPGEYELVVQGQGRTARESIQVTADATRALTADATVGPANPTVYVRPSATVRLRNPWNRTVESTVAIEGPGTTVVREVAVPPGERTELTAQLERQPAGAYSLRVSGDGQPLTTEPYRVQGDERLGAALAASGYGASGGGLERALEFALGNLAVLVAALAGLTALTVVGAMSAVLARAVRAKRRTIGVYRATGASPRRMLWLVLVDAARIGAVAALLALGVATLVTVVLADLGALTAFGIALDPWPSLGLAAGLFAGSVALTMVAATVATVSLVRTPVRELLSEQ